ncbi:class I adenylate-forming enzyme family protein [Rhodococcus globerulus]|uniref:class I adenylate-forming enzyme family protein n=1 Tax=Rhodococcus globerulus TaxID=33008 RepID=UPI000A7D345F|nr:AMP-binding protein [Rhodococcus globerulus]
MTTDVNAAPAVSIAHGVPLLDEPGLGALTLPGFLREVTQMYGDREALVMRSDDAVVRWSYAQLWERAIEVAQALRGIGLGKDGRVGVLMTNRPEWIASVFGTALAGGVAVTLSTFSTAAELDYLLENSAVSVLLFERTVLGKDLAEVLTTLEPQFGTAAPGTVQSPRFPFLRHLAMVGDGEAIGAIDTWDTFRSRGVDQSRGLIESIAAAVRPSDAAVLFFSSGTTSKPKGILSAHRGVSIQMWRFRRMYRFNPEDNIRCWSANGFFWSGNFAMALGTTFASGGSLVLQSTFDAAEAIGLIESEQVNFPFAWPHQWAQFESAPNWTGADLSSLSYVDFNTPVARHPSVTATWFEPGHAYGNTETFTISTCFPANTPDDVTGGSSGEPLPGTTVKVVDALTGDVLPIGERGEICVKGPTLMLGYIGTPLSETVDAEGFFHTGDGGYLDDVGRLFWEGRLTDIIKTGGANVSPLEVDEALVSHPGVKVTRTVGVPHETLGEVVVSCIVAHEGTDLHQEEIRTFLRERLASYKVPRHVLFFDEDQIALTGSAKIKSSEVRERAAQLLKA